MSEVKLTGKTDFDLNKKINFAARHLFSSVVGLQVEDQ